MPHHSLNLLLIALILPFALTAQSVDDILQKHYKAIGQEQLTKVQTFTVKGSFRIMEREGDFTLYLKRPDMLRNEGRLISAAATTVIKGNKGYQSVEGQPAKEVPVYQLKNQLKYTSVDDPIYEAQHAKAVITYEGKDHRNGKTMYKLKIVHPNTDSTIAFIDVTTNYLLFTQTYSNAPGTQAGRVDRTYSEFVKESDGIVMPHKIVIISLIEQMEARSTVKIEKVTYNPSLRDKLFEKP